MKLVEMNKWSVCMHALGILCEPPRGSPWLLSYAMQIFTMWDRWTGVPCCSVCIFKRFFKKRRKLSKPKVELFTC